MACFLVPAGEGIVTEIVKKAEAKKEQNGKSTHSDETKIPFSRKLNWLSKLLWGGSILLAFEHVWHGEVVPFFPFLTNYSQRIKRNVLFSLDNTLCATSSAAFGFH